VTVIGEDGECTEDEEKMMMRRIGCMGDGDGDEKFGCDDAPTKQRRDAQFYRLKRLFGGHLRAHLSWII